LDLRTRDDQGCCLEAGIYSPSRIEPAMTFTLGPGWNGVALADDYFMMSHPDGASLYFARDVEPGDGLTALNMGTVEAWLRSVDGLRVETATDVDVGGSPALQFDVVALQPLRYLLMTDEHAHDLPKDQKARFVFFALPQPVGDQAHGLFVIESSMERFEAALAVAQPVVDSVEFRESR
jgi:hypothetical protein